jgi:hypothetical protein
LLDSGFHRNDIFGRNSKLSIHGVLTGKWSRERFQRRKIRQGRTEAGQDSFKIREEKKS